MRVLLGGGGSGGHVFPALAVAEALRARSKEPVEFLFAGTAEGMEGDIIADAGLRFAPVMARAMRGRNLVSKLFSAGALAVGVLDALGVLLRFRPDVVLLTGGYVSVPAGLAAWLLRRPLVLFQPDVEPGWGIRALAPFATKICVSHEASLAGHPAAKGVHSGYPLRAAFADLDKPMARAHFQLNGGPALLVTGAVQGARRINDAVHDQLEDWLELAQLIHISGPLDHERLRARREQLAPNLRARYRLYDYLGDEMPVAMAACDLAISRSGASVLGELPAAGLPALLVPLGEAGGHQRFNAETLAASGAVEVLDNDAVPERLLPTATALIGDETRLAELRKGALALRRLDAADAVAQIVIEARR